MPADPVLPAALSAAEWAVSSYSGSSGGQCVEFSRSLVPSGLVPVRDSKNRGGHVLLVSAPAWAAFTARLAG